MSSELYGPDRTSLTITWQRPLGSRNLPSRLPIWEFKLETLGWGRNQARRQIIPISFRDWAGHQTWEEMAM